MSNIVVVKPIINSKINQLNTLRSKVCCKKQLEHLTMSFKMYNFANSIVSYYTNQLNILEHIVYTYYN